MVGWGGVMDRRAVMSGGRVVRISDVLNFLMDDTVTVMRITDMLHWLMGLGDMMANMWALNMMSLRCFVMLGCRMVWLSGMVLRLRLLLCKHQVSV